MATRHLRRIQEQASKHSAQVISLREEDDDEEEEAVESKTAPFNPFDLLSDEVRWAAGGR
jgi:hypothetical protein